MFPKPFMGSVLFFTIAGSVLGQEISTRGLAQPSATIDGVNIAIPSNGGLQQAPEPAADYRLGPGDQITIQVVDVKEIPSTPYRIDAGGYIRVPTIGRISVGGLTTEGVASLLREDLKRVVVDPDVTVSISEFRSQPVSVVGAVVNPGIRQLEGHKTLFQILLLAGGLRPEAGDRIHITRDLKYGRLPLPNAADDPSGRFSVGFVNVKDVMKASQPKDNIEIQPDDVISIPRGELIYVIGAVEKPGGYVLSENDSLSTLKLLSLAGGLNRLAAARRARILRAVPDSMSRTEIAVDLRKVLDGKSSDVSLKPNDVLIVPTSRQKALSMRTIETMIGLGMGATTAAIYRY